MKAYGVKKSDSGCCPGHNKVSDHSYNNRRSIKAKRRDTKWVHGRERSQNQSLSILKKLEKEKLTECNYVEEDERCYGPCCTILDGTDLNVEDLLNKHIINH